ncbi:MAG: glycosyltransferase family 4 protein, partial [Planctomycetota bacterium]
LLLAWWLVQEGFEHLHCHFGNSGASTGMLAAELAGMPFSFTCHGSELRAPERHFLAEKIARAAFVACVSWYGRAQLMLLCPPEHWPKLHVVRCGLPPLDAPTRRRAGVRPRVLCVGRLSAEKGHQVLFQALSALRARGVDLDCTLVGDGPQRAALMAESTALGLSDRVRFAGGLELDQVLEHYGQADVLVLSSLSEGVPVVLMEAMALGCPVVATSVGGVPELVRNRETGLLVPPGNPRELADALQWVLDHPDDAQQVAAEAARRVRKEFALSSTTGALIRLFEGSRSCAKPCPAVAEPVPA